MIINPWLTKESLRNFLKRINERDELDKLIIIYLKDILNKNAPLRPSSGPPGEGGKDIVVLEDTKPISYCSFVLKKGNLSGNLKGRFGIIKQVDDAMSVPLELSKYRDANRTVTVVHNGYEGSRGAVKRYESAIKQIEAKYQNVLTRPIERWDLDIITNCLFPHEKYFTESEIIKSILNRNYKLAELSVNFAYEFKEIYAEDALNKDELIKIAEKYQTQILDVDENYNVSKYLEKGVINGKNITKDK